VPDGGWVVEDVVAGAEVVVVSAAVWVDVVATVVAIRGRERGVMEIGEVNGVRWIAWRRESSSGFGVLSGSDSIGSEGVFGGSRISGSSTSVCDWLWMSYNEISGRSALR